jgi:hypothetical protein
MINLNLSECNSSFSIEINKKEVEGIWLEHNEYKVYEDMSSRIVLLPDNIFLRGNCIECLSKNICQPKSFCPLTNSGQRGWDFVGDLIFNISSLEAAIAGKIQEAELCLYNTYASSNSSINTYIKTIESSICEPLYQRINVEELKNSTDIPRITRKEQAEEVFKPEWICTDIKSIIEEKISKDNATNQLTLRLIGEDMKNTNQPFTCFDSGISSIPECDRKAPQTCSPYINISYTYE